MESSIVSRAASRRGVGLVVIAAMLWGTVGVTTQALYALSATTALSIGFFRLALGFPLLAVACAHVLGRRAWDIPRRDLARMALMGVMLAQYQVCFFVAIRHAGVAVATLVTLCTAPVLVAALSAVLASERPTRAVLLALACALAGTSLLVGFTPGSRMEGTSLYGVGFALASALGYAVITLVGRSVAPRYHPLQVNVVGFGVGAVLLLVLALPSGLVVQYPARGWLLLVYLGAVPSALAYGVFMAGMRTTPATVASIVTLLEPLVATVLAWLLLGEALSRFGAAGALLLLGAMGLLLRDGRPAKAIPLSADDPTVAVRV